MAKTQGKGRKILDMMAYSCADTYGGGVGQVISLYYLSFLMTVGGMGPIMAGLITGIGKIWDGITDPVMGVLVDRTKTRFGSSRPWMLISLPFVLVSYFMLWYCFGITSLWGKFFYFTFAYMFYSTAYTIAVVPYESLLPKMVDGYQERTNYTSMRMIFSGVGCVASTYIYEWLVPVSQSNPLSPAFTNNFIWLGLALGIMFTIPILITALFTKEKFAPRKNDNALTVKGVFKTYGEVLKSKLYRKYYALVLLGTFCSSAISSAFLIFFYLTYYNIQNFVLTFTLSFILINLKGAIEIAFFVPNVVFMKKISKHFPYLVDIPLLVIGCGMCCFITSATPVWVFLVASCFIGAGVSCLGFVPNTLLPDLSDVDELIYGKRREGTNAGLVTLGKKIVSGLTITLFGIILGLFGFDTGASSSLTPEQSTSGAMIAVKLMLCAIPVIAGVVMIIVSRTYGLNGKSHGMIKAAIADKRATGKTELSEEDRKTCEKLTGLPYQSLWISEADASEDACA